MCIYHLADCKICTFAEKSLKYAFYISNIQMYIVLSILITSVTQSAT